MEKALNLARLAKEKIRHPGFQKYFKNMGWAFAGRVFALGASFIVGAMVARYLGPERYGVLNYVLSFVTILAFLANLGIDNILPRDIIKHQDQKEKIINTAFALKLVGGVLVVIISTCLAFFVVKDDNYTNALIFIYSIQTIFLSINVVDSYFIAEAKNKYIFIGQFISTTLVSVLKLYLIFAGFGTGWFITALLFEVLVYSSIAMIIFRRDGMKLKLDLNIAMAKEMLRDSWPFILTSAFAIIYTRIDQVIIGKMLSNQALGIYAAGVKPAEVWYFIPALICSSLFPAVMNAKMIDQKTYIKRFKGLLYSIFGLSFAVALFEFIFAKYIVLFLFGEPFLEAAGIIRIYTWAGIAVAVIMVIQQYLTIENKSMIIMFSSLVGAAVNIVLNILLIPKFEITGSAYATLISYFCIPLIIVAMLSINKRMKARRLQIQ